MPRSRYCPTLATSPPAQATGVAESQSRRLSNRFDGRLTTSESPDADISRLPFVATPYLRFSSAAQPSQRSPPSETKPPPHLRQFRSAPIFSSFLLNSRTAPSTNPVAGQDEPQQEKRRDVLSIQTPTPPDGLRSIGIARTPSRSSFTRCGWPWPTSSRPRLRRASPPELPASPGARTPSRRGRPAGDPPSSRS